LNLDLNLDFLRDSKVWGIWLFSNIYDIIMKVFYSLHISRPFLLLSVSGVLDEKIAE